MKKKIIGFVIAIALIVIASISMDKWIAEADLSKIFGEDYMYEVTDVNGEMIQAEPLNYVSKHNLGVFLFRPESEGFKAGDKVVVEWKKNSENKRIFKSAEKYEES